MLRLGLLSAALLAAAGMGGCGGHGVAPPPADSPPLRPEALSLLGTPLYAPALAPPQQARLQAQLDSAMARLRAAPDDVDAIIWAGRRLAYMGRYRDAIELFSEGLEKHPQEPRLFRHRGHRYITTRQFGLAIADLEAAAALVQGEPDEVEPDGQPNAAGIPVSTLHTNIYYHLALAHYLEHDFERALPVWLRALAASANDDMLVATSDWLYMTYRRLGRTREAAAVLDRIHGDMHILENQAYFRRLMLYKGELEPESLLASDTEDAVQLATYGYGVANWYLYNDHAEQARTLFHRIVSGPNWAAFGFIAAEAELRDR